MYRRIKSISSRSISVAKTPPISHASIGLVELLGIDERDASKNQSSRWRVNSSSCTPFAKRARGSVFRLRCLGKPNLRHFFRIKKPTINSKPLKMSKQIWKMNVRWIGSSVEMSDTEKRRYRITCRFQSRHVRETGGDSCPDDYPRAPALRHF